MTDVDMAMSGMITFVLLVFLIGCLNGQNIPTHPDRVTIKTKGRTAVITCQVDSSTLQSNPLHWYRAQSGGAFQRLIYFEAGSKIAKIDGDNKKKYAGSVRNDQVSLTISTLTLQDTGSYYCALYTGDKKVFGSGTRLYVTDPGKDKINPPTVSAYLSRKTSNKQTMLCHAKDMFPDLVTFTWKKKSNTGVWTDVSEEVMEQSNSENSKVTSVTSMMIVDENTARGNLYKCVANHEGGSSKETELKKDNKDILESDKPGPTCPTNTGDTVKTLKQQRSGNSEQMPSLYLFVYAYGVMLMKNGIYFCAVSIFLLKRKFGKKE